MSRPSFRFLPAACAVLSIGFTACVGTVYDRMYSNKKTYYKPPAAKKEASAEDVLGALDNRNTGEQPVDSAGAVPPPPGGEIPGLPPAMGEPPPPAADPSMAPPAVPGLPPPPAS